MTQTENRLSIALEGIGHLLKDNRLQVPAYQRSYSWYAENARELFDDIEAALIGLEKEYFLGSIVVSGGLDDVLDVVDGQQRLATVAILISCIRDFFRPKKRDPQAAQAIEQDFIATLSRRGGVKEPRLKLNEVDNPLYEECIVEGKSKPGFSVNKSSHARLLEVKGEAAQFIEEYVNRHRTTAKLHDLLDYIERHTKVIVVHTPDDANAFVIFEALNDRGLELAISDLIKNYLFHKAAEKIDEVKSRWLQMSSTLEAVSDDPLLVPYLRHFCSARYGTVREKDLFSVIKKRVSFRKLAIEFSIQLLDSSKKYAALLNSEHEIWAPYKDESRDCIRNLNTLGMVQVRPLLLSALEKFSQKEIEKLLPKIVAAAVRFQVVGGNGAGTLERIYCGCAKQISQGSITTASEVVAELSTVPSDTEFEREFLVFSISRSGLARFYLTCLELNATQASGNQQVPNPSTNKVNLEHILPLTYSKAWNSSFTIDQARAYSRRLGNLALLSARLNSTVGNGPFAGKISAFQQSPFATTQSIGLCSEWTPNQIDARQQVMAKLALKIWKFA